MEQKIVSAQNERKLALEECELTIRNAFRRGLDSTLEMVAALQRIEDEELWTEHDGYEDKTLNFYIQNFLKWDLASVARVRLIDSTVQELKSANLPLPENETQVAELAKLDREVRGPVWRSLLGWSERNERPITVARVRQAVELEKEEQEKARAREEADTTTKAAAKQKKGIDPALNLDDVPQANKAAAGRPPRNEKAEEALDRIRLLCGDDVGDAIDGGSLPIGSNDLLKWAQQDDALVKNLAYYVVNRRWTVAQAIAEERRLIDGDTTVDQLITFARARSGRFSVAQDDAQILVTITS